MTRKKCLDEPDYKMFSFVFVWMFLFLALILVFWTINDPAMCVVSFTGQVSASGFMDDFSTKAFVSNGTIEGQGMLYGSYYLEVPCLSLMNAGKKIAELRS